MTDAEIRSRYGPITDVEILLVRAVRNATLEEAAKACKAYCPGYTTFVSDSLEWNGKGPWGMGNNFADHILSLKEPAND